MLKKKNGQSTIEYILLVTIVVAVLILFLSPGGPFGTTLDQTLNDASTGMTDMSQRLLDSRGDQP